MLWKRVIAVQRAEVGPESIHEIGTETDSMVLTGGHRVYTSHTEKVEAEKLRPGDMVQTVQSEHVVPVKITYNRRLPDRQYMYDLTAEDWHNFVLARSSTQISNSPDRNYHFRPPTHEETVRQFNRVFGHIWEDEELKEYLDRGLDMVMAYPPRTPFSSLDALVQRYPDWKTLVITAGKMLALDALRINWIADEFNYSIGGISLDIDKASKYESAMQAAADQFDKQIEKAKATVNVIRGVQQPRFGTGVRSAFGPYTGAGVLTPAKFLGV